MSKTRTCHFRAGGSCGKLTALPLSVDDAAPDGSGREDLRLYKLEQVEPHGGASWGEPGARGASRFTG